MERNWYVICTQKKQEKKVMAQLNKKGIEYFCPYTNVVLKQVSRKTREYAPLFRTQVFVHTSAPELMMLTKIPGVINPLYWRSQPAIINPDEINAIRMLTENYHSIQVERSGINLTEKVRIVERSITSYNNRVMSVKHQGISVTLPSLGYTLTTEREKAVTETMVMKKQPVSRSLVSRLNPLVLFGF